MTHKEYNGWTNYETWLVKLWMDNEQGTQEFFAEQAEDLLKRYPDTDDESDLADKLAEIVKSQHEESLPELQGFAADLMNAALSEVNWGEIAFSLLSDAKEALAQ